MKLNETEITFIENVARTAAMFNIDNIIIEQDSVRALDDNRTVYILATEGIPELSFGSVCITRVGLFLSRLQVAKSRKNFSVEAVMHSDGFAQSFTFKGTGTKIDYRASNPLKAKIPKGFNDDHKTSVDISDDFVDVVGQGQSAMGAKMMTIISNDEVWFEMVDINKDVFKHIFAEKAEAITEDDITKFAHMYPIAHIQTLFKNTTSGKFTIGCRIGTLASTVNGIDVFIVPQQL